MTKQPLTLTRLNRGDHDMVVALTEDESHTWANHLWRVNLAKSGDIPEDAVDREAVRLFPDAATTIQVDTLEDGRPLLACRGRLEIKERTDA